MSGGTRHFAGMHELERRRGLRLHAARLPRLRHRQCWWRAPTGLSECSRPVVPVEAAGLPLPAPETYGCPASEGYREAFSGAAGGTARPTPVAARGPSAEPRLAGPRGRREDVRRAFEARPRQHHRGGREPTARPALLAGGGAGRGTDRSGPRGVAATPSQSGSGRPRATPRSRIRRSMPATRPATPRYWSCSVRSLCTASCHCWGRDRRSTGRRYPALNGRLRRGGVQSRASTSGGRSRSAGAAPADGLRLDGGGTGAGLGGHHRPVPTRIAAALPSLLRRPPSLLGSASRCQPCNQAACFSFGARSE